MRLARASSRVLRTGKVILVKLRYAPGWRLPGGGRRGTEEPQEAVLRELREEIGMTSHGTVDLACEFDEEVDHKRDLASLFSCGTLNTGRNGRGRSRT